MADLEKRLQEALISFTDKILHFPCLTSRPKTEYPDYHHWNYKYGGTDRKADTLFVAVKDKTYKQIAEAMYEGLTGVKKDIWNMSQKERRMLWLKYEENLDRIRQLRYFK